MPFWEDLTTKPFIAEMLCGLLKRLITEVGRDDILKNPLVLDIGGGKAEFSKKLNELGLRCVSLDEKDLDQNPGAIQIRGNAYKIPFRNNSFDIVYGRGIFDTRMYYHDFDKLSAEIARVLKPNGIFFVYGADLPPNENFERDFTLLPQKEDTAVAIWEKKQPKT